MAKETNETVKSGRERLTGRYSPKFPDRKWDEEGSDNDIFGLAADELEDYDKRKSENDAQRKQFNDLFNKDPMSAGLMRAWARGESNPISYLVTKFGDKLKEALDSEEGKKQFAEAHEQYLAKEAADAKADEEYIAAIKQSLETLKSFGEKNGLDEDAQVQLFLKAHKYVQDALDGIYSEEFFKMLNDGGNYSGDVERARNEGEVAGRNAKIRSQLKKTETGKMMPPSLGGESYEENENEAAKRPSTIPMFGIPAAGQKKKNY